MKKFLQKYYPEITGIIVFITYLFTISHSIGENDSGELAMAQATLSIPHPTGYPLFVLLGFLFNKIPLPFTTIYQLNLLCAIWCTLTIIVVIRISSMIIENLYLLLGKKGKSLLKSTQIKTADKIFASVFSGLMLAYSATFWLQSTRVEVYSLQIFLTSIIIYFTLKIFIKYKQQQLEGNAYKTSVFKQWWIVFLFLGLGFANHMMTLYLIPATAVIFFFTTGINKESLKSILKLFSLIAVVSLLFYSGLMLRATTNPPWSWGDVSNIKSLFDHITAKEYSTYMFQGIDSFKEQTAALLKMISFNFSKDSFSTGEFSLSLVFGVAGLLLIFFFRKEVISYFVLVIIVSVTLAMSYKIPDINEYFLVPFFMISILSITSMILILKIIGDRKFLKTTFVIFLGLIISIQFIINYRYADRSDFYIFEDFYKSAVKDLPSNSILLTDKWSLFLSPGLYYQNVENIRKDVYIVSTSGLIMNNWYRKKYKEQITLDKELIIKKKDLFISLDIATRKIHNGVLNLPDNAILIPYPYYYRMVYDNNYYPLDGGELNIRLNKKPKNEADAYIYTLIPFMLEQRIFYELNFNQTEKAFYYFNLIRNTFNNYTISQKTMNALKSKGVNVN